MSESLDIRSYRKGDEKQILELFSRTYVGRQLSLKYWLWRFRENPSGHGVIELAWENNILAAHYAVTSVVMQIGGQDVLAGLSGTTMTHPYYRGRGIFPILARRTYQEMVARGMMLVWGFPNTMSHRGFACALNWQDVYEVPVFRLWLEPQNIASSPEISHVRELLDADERFDRLWARICNEYDIIVRRDKSYIQWRYFSNPTEKYRLIAYLDNEEIQGYAVFKRYRDELQVVDLLIGKNDVEVGKNLIKYIMLQGQKAEVKSIALWLNLTHPFHHALESIGFKPEGPVTYLGGLSLNQKLDASLYDYRRWYFTMGDSDVF